MKEQEFVELLKTMRWHGTSGEVSIQNKLCVCEKLTL